MTAAPSMRARPHLVVEDKTAHGAFEEARHPRDRHGRWAHVPGSDVRVKIPNGYHVGERVEVQQHDFRAPGQPMRWYPATVENVTGHASGRTLDIQVRMHEDGRPHVQTIGVRGGNPRIRPAPVAVLPRLPAEGRPNGTGTLDDPIAVGSDLARAAQLLAEGKHIRLSQPGQVATLLDKLRATVEDARAKGQKAPKYDLCRVSVPDTNLFCKQSKNIPRAKMPQLRGAIVPGSPAEAFRTPKGRGNVEQPFRDSLAAMGLPIQAKTMPASHLRASQAELDGVKVAEMAAAMERGEIPDAPIFVTRDGYVIDGHHRWAAKVALDTRDGRLGEVMMPVEVVNLDIGAAIDYANAFAQVMGIAPKTVGEGKSRPRPYLIVSGTLPPMQTSAHARVQALEAKSAHGKFEEAKHPRDKHGRFLSIGARVDLGGGKGGGEVTHASQGSITVKRDDGKSVTVHGAALKDVAVTGGSPGGGSPGGAPNGPAGNGPTAETPRAPAAAPAVPSGPRYAADRAAAATPGSAPPVPLNDHQYAQHTAQIEAAIKHALDNGQSTDALYSLDGKGQVWNPDRAKQHKEIVDQLWAQNANVPSDGKALIAGGLGGAGKSTVLKKFAGVDQSQFITVNPDDVKQIMADRGMVPKVPGLSPMEASALVHEESSHVANLLAQRAYAENKNIIWDITMSSQGSVQRRIAEMKSKGYGDVSAVFVDIPVETSVGRALSRHRNGMEQHRAGTGVGGRYVPPSIIRANRHATYSSANRSVFEGLKGQFSSWQVWDNSVAGRPPKLVASSGGSATAGGVAA